MRSQSTFLFSLFSLLLQPHVSLFYSLQNCTIDFDDHSQIVCDHNKLTSVPPGLPKTATSLSVFDNDIQRIRQTDFKGFTRLQFLHLGMNDISHIEEGAFSDLSAVTEIMLSFNELTALTDNTFTGLSNLTSLYLNKNKIYSVSQYAFRPLKELQILDMGSNNLVQISNIINIVTHCPAIKNLSLNSNQLTSFESNLFPTHFLNLTQLDLQSNPLKRFRVHGNVFPSLNELRLPAIMPDCDWDVSDRSLTRVRSLIVELEFGIQVNLQLYKSIFQSVNKAESVYLSYSALESPEGLLPLTCEIPTLQKLDSFLNIIRILNETLLQSCTNLTELHLQTNSMSDLSDCSLCMMKQLTQLSIESNELSKIPTTIRNMSTLTYLSFEQNLITDLHCSDFSHLTSLSELNLNSNRISSLNSCMFKGLENLKILQVKNNFISLQLDSFGFTLAHLTHLNAAENSLRWFQKGTFKSMQSLVELNLKSNRYSIVDNGAFEGLTNLKTLTYSPSYFYIGDFTSFKQLEKLIMFVFYSTLNTTTNNDFSFNMSSLHELNVIVDVSTCFTWTRNLLNSIRNLRVLSFENYCCRVFDDDMFIVSPKLLRLQFINCDQFTHTSKLFHPLKDLNVLDLTNDNIQSLDFLRDANLTKVEKLILKDNKLLVINETVFETLTSLKHLDLSGNPFACNCSNAGFIDWVIRNKQVQVVNAFQYRCSSPPSEEGNFLLDFNVQSCWEFTGFLCFISSSALVLVTLLSSFTYHFLRWQLVYGYYLLLAFLYDSKKRRQGCPYIYDAFVSYNVHDEDWVYRELLPELEGVQGWRLCLHHRDFQPGKPIIENITDAIYSSRKTLCVISRRYLQSEWCSQEIQMASYRLFDEQKDVLILLFLEEISSNQLSPFYRMRKLVKSRTYLSWTQARNHRGLFWEKVQRALECDNEPADSHNPLTANVY
uniref:Toll-like receptor 23d n=1 Tax=Boleophthalmus pectinirostris TaxID=150288 RepID=A0A482IBT4_BOLPE|nr:toll-like receptor 23d [Boleophthalmus pectinirostris]